MTRKTVGRPRADIDMKVVEGMASVGATNVEIADFVGVHESTIRDRCADVLLKARASVRMRLRQAQMKSALSGNPAMLIWLGKQTLGQADKAAVEHSGPNGAPITHAVHVTHRVVDPAHESDAA